MGDEIFLLLLGELNLCQKFRGVSLVLVLGVYLSL